MASAEGCEILYLVADEMLFSDIEQEDGLASGPPARQVLECFGLPEAGRARRVFWPFSRIACRSSVRGNC